MFTLLYKFIVGWIMPPGCFMLALIFLIRKIEMDPDMKKKRVIILTSWGLLICMYLFSSPLFSSLITKGLEHRYTAVTTSQIGKSNLIIVLSAGIAEQATPNLSSLSAVPSMTGVIRLSEAARIYKTAQSKGNTCTILLTGGRLWGKKYTEFEIYKQWLISLGISEQDIIGENKSATTFENAQFSKELIENTSSEKIFLVTTASHMPRAMSTFAKLGFKIIPAPCDFSDSGKITLLSFVPDTGSLNKTRLALWEYLGRIFYAFK